MGVDVSSYFFQNGFGYIYVGRDEMHPTYQAVPPYRICGMYVKRGICLLRQTLVGEGTLCKGHFLHRRIIQFVVYMICTDVCTDAART